MLAGLTAASVGLAAQPFAAFSQESSGQAAESQTQSASQADQSEQGATEESAATAEAKREASESAEASTNQAETQSNDGGVQGQVKGLPEAGANAEDGLPVPLQKEGKGIQHETGDPAEQAVMGYTGSSSGKEALEHYDLARFYFSHWDMALAEVELEATIMYAPNMKIAHRDYCVVSLLRGHPVRALAEAAMVVGLGDAIPLNEKEQQELMQRASKAHYREGLKLARSRQWDAALSELQWAQAYTPDKSAVARSLAFCYASKGDFGKAEKVYSSTLALDPDDAFTHADFAVLLAGHGDEARAQGQLSQAIKLAPDAAALHVDMGWLAETKGDFQTAEKELNEAIKLCPKQPGLWLQLGHIRQRAGHVAEAKDAYKEVLALDETEEDARQQLEKLNVPASKPVEKQDAAEQKARS